MQLGVTFNFRCPSLASILLFLFLMLFFSNAKIANGQTINIKPVNNSHKFDAKIVFLGDSITAGYGIGANKAYPALLQKGLERFGYKVAIVNAGVSGDTTAGGVRRIDWLLREPADILFLALGANDGLRGLSTKSAEKNLREIIRKTRTKYPQTKIIVAGMKVPPSMGQDYYKEFEKIYLNLANDQDLQKLTVIPFLLEGVAGSKSLNLADLIHPNEEGQKVIAKLVEPYLLKVLNVKVD